MTMHLPPKLVVFLTVAAAALSAYAQIQAMAAEAPKGQAIYFGTAEELCRSNGVLHFEDRDEWPTTRDGRATLEVVRERCAKNPKSFGVDKSVALVEPEPPVSRR